MAHVRSASLWIRALGDCTLDGATDPGAEGTIRGNLQNAEGGQFWTDGSGTGQIAKILRRERTIAAAATHNYNLLAAGSLTDIAGTAIDADEMKGFELRCTSGSIKLVASAGTPIGLFLAAGDGVNVPNGCTIGVDWGTTGLDVTVNSLFEITDTAGGAGSAYELWAVVAE